MTSRIDNGAVFASRIDPVAPARAAIDSGYEGLIPFSPDPPPEAPLADGPERAAFSTETNTIPAEYFLPPRPSPPEPAPQPATLAPPAPAHPGPAARGLPDQPDPADLKQRLNRSVEVMPRKRWRRFLGFGPERDEQAAIQRQLKLQVTFPGPVTIMVASPKGASGKTPTARGLGAAFASARGGGVVVWDNNELRGTLLARSVATTGTHVGELLASLDWFARHDASILDIERTMHRQPVSHEWVLACDPDATAPMTREQFLRLHHLLSRFFPIVIIDSGSNELATSWRAADAVADLVVVPTKWRSDHLSPAAHMVQSMGQRGDRVSGRAVVVGTNAPGEADLVAREEATSYFGQPPISLPVFEIPSDPALMDTTIRWQDLRPETRAAYEEVAAALSDMAMAPVGFDSGVTIGASGAYT